MIKSMETNQVFRWLFTGIFVSMLSISGFFRYRARRSGEAIPRAREGTGFLVARLLFAAPLYLPIFAYILNPGWMKWSAMPLPAGLRWVGAAIGLTTLALVYRVFRSIGNSISETTLTKENHVLVTRGPYRWVRHPLYSAATIGLLSLSVIAANWFMLAMACVVLAAVALLVVPREEAELLRKFGKGYQEYMRVTGRFAPRFFR